MYSVYVTIQVIGILLLLAALGILFFGEVSKEQKVMVFFVNGSLTHNCAYLLELTAQSKEAAIAATKMEYLGSALIAVCYCWFMYSYCYAKAPEKLLKLLAGIELPLMALIFTCDRHPFFYRRIEWVTDAGEHPHLQLTYGPVYFLFILCAWLIPYILSTYVLLRTLIRRPDRRSWKRYGLFIPLTLMPYLALLFYICRLTLAYDITPVVTGLELSLVVILVWSRRTYDVTRVAAEVMLQDMEDGVILLDEERQLVSYNQSASDIFPELNFLSVGDGIREMEDFPEGILDGEPPFCFRLNNCFYESHVRKIPGKNGRDRGYVVFLANVTETVNYQEEIEKVRREAERASIAKSEFLANMSHEIRTPMNAIVGLSDIIMEESRGRKVYNYACDIRSASQNLLTIINDILDLSKVEAGKMELVTADYYIKSLVGEVMNMMDVAASQRGLLLKCEYDTSIPCAYHGDEGRIKQILINLLNNAVKFTAEGYVKLTIQGSPSEQEGMENLVFIIEDTGCGIRQEDLEKIFEDFRQVDSKRNRSVEGTGLGLSIVRRLVGLMKGSVGVESVYGGGTVFTVTLPQKIVDARSLEEMPEAPEKEYEQVETFEVNGRYRVLVVDDNLINRKVAVGFLKNYGFELTEAASGFEALELVKKTKFNMIFMDHMMPEMDGIETVQKIREECGENGKTPVIIALTANAMNGVRETFLRSGFQDFISKPLDRKPLYNVLSKWIPNAYKSTKREKRDADGKDTAQSAVRPEYEDIRIPGIRPEEAKKHHSGGVSDYLELLQLYCMDGRRKQELLEELVQKADYQNYRIEVHGLKSASANIGAMELSSQARELEEAAVRGDEEFIRLHAGELLSCYVRLTGEIETFLAGQSAAQADERTGPAADMDGAALLEQVREALSLLEDFHSKECIAKIDSLIQCCPEGEAGDCLKKIKELLRLYEDDEAEELLRHLIEGLEKGGMTENGE